MTAEHDIQLQERDKTVLFDDVMRREVPESTGNAGKLSGRGGSGRLRNIVLDGQIR